MKHLTKAIPDNKYDNWKALAKEVIGYEAQVADEDGKLGPNPQTEDQWFQSIFNGACIKAVRHMRKLKRNIDLGEVEQDEM